MAACNSEKSDKVNFETEIHWELPETVIGKEGLRKKILQKGNSWKTPLPGDEIQGMIFFNLSIVFLFTIYIYSVKMLTAAALTFLCYI